jgi:hypothetical protein
MALYGIGVQGMGLSSALLLGQIDWHVQLCEEFCYLKHKIFPVIKDNNILILVIAIAC